MKCSVSCVTSICDRPANYNLAAALRVEHCYINFTDEENSDSKTGLLELNFL